MKWTSRHPLVCVALAVVVGASNAACAEAQQGSVDTARKMLAVRDYAGCLREIDTLLQGRAGDRDTYITRGLCSAGRGDYPSAIADYTRALELDSRSVQALYYRGVARSQAGATTEGIGDFDRAISVDPSFATAYGGRAAALRLVGDDARALADLSQAIQLQPKNPALLHSRGCLLYDMREWDAARMDFERAIQLDPGGQPLSRARLWLIHARSDDAFANRVLREVLGSANLTASVWERRILGFLIGDVSEADLVSATADTEPSVAAGREVQANFYAGSVRLLRGDQDGARRLFEAAVATDRKSFSEYFSASAELTRLPPSQ